MQLLVERHLSPMRLPASELSATVDSSSVPAERDARHGLGPGRPSPSGILAMSGFIPTVERWEPSLEHRRDLPVLVTHGARDPVISVQFARDARSRLVGAGLDVEYREHGGGHHLDQGTLALMQAWVDARVASFVS